MRLAKIVLTGFAVAMMPIALPAPILAQASIQMRPDEAFWNAIRDSGNAASFQLFIQTHPDSPYVKDAQAALAALETATPAPPKAPVAAGDTAVPDLDAVVAALVTLGWGPDVPEGQAPDPDQMEAYLADLRDQLGIDNSTDVTDDELRNVVFLAKSAPAWTEAGYDGFAVGEVVARLQMVHESVIGGETPLDLSTLTDDLARHFQRTKVGFLTAELLWDVLEEPVTFPFEADERRQVFGDWVLQTNAASNYVAKMCYVFPKPDTVRWTGPLLTTFRPGGPRFIYTDGSGSSLSIWYAPGDEFARDEPVKLSAGGRDLPLIYVENEYSLPKFDEPDEPGVGYTGKGVTFLKRASGDVHLTGTTGWGLPLDVTLLGQWLHQSVSSNESVMRGRSTRCLAELAARTVHPKCCPVRKPCRGKSFGGTSHERADSTNHSCTNARSGGSCASYAESMGKERQHE